MKLCGLPVSKQVLIVDDDDDSTVAILQELASQCGYEAERAKSWREALTLLGKQHWDRMFLDLNLGTGLQDGFHLLDAMQREGKLIPTQVVSLSADLRQVEAALGQFAQIVRERPIPKQDLWIYRPFLVQFLTESIRSPVFASTTQNEVFVVHGRDHGQRDRIVSIIHSLGLSPVILAKAPAQGKTIIQLLSEHASTAIFCTVIMTGDDIGYLRTDEDKKRLRPRQNVLLELGLFYGTLGGERVLCLVDPDVEKPTDLGGVLYEDLGKSDDEIQRRIMRELQSLEVAFKIP